MKSYIVRILRAINSILPGIPDYCTIPDVGVRPRYTLGKANNDQWGTHQLLDWGLPTGAIATLIAINNIYDECEITGGEFLGGFFYSGIFMGGEFHQGEYFSGTFDRGEFYGRYSYFGGEYLASSNILGAECCCSTPSMWFVSNTITITEYYASSVS